MIKSIWDFYVQIILKIFLFHLQNYFILIFLLLANPDNFFISYLDMVRPILKYQDFQSFYQV